MQYVLIMTEGKTELALINVLIDKKLLRFSTYDLLFEKAYHKRQLDVELINKISMLDSSDTVVIYRVGDLLSEKLKIKKPGFNHRRIDDVVSISTLPEFEILFILNEGLYDDYLKYKSKYKASEYYKMINKEYNKQYDFVYRYFNEMSNERIINLLKLYNIKRIKTHLKNQKSLLDIIRR